MLHCMLCCVLWRAECEALLALAKHGDIGAAGITAKRRSTFQVLIVPTALKVLLHLDMCRCCVLLQAFDSPGFPLLASLGVGEQLTCGRTWCLHIPMLGAHECPLT